MSLAILNLSTCFPEVFQGQSNFSFDSIIKLLQIHDTLNQGCYKTLTEKDFNGFQKKAGANADNPQYQLYYRSNGADGGSVWTAIEDSFTPISSSTELYLRKVDAKDPPDEDDYVSLYSLIQLDPDRFNSRFDFKKDPAMYVTAALYATCCLHKKMMELFMNDIEAINDEQQEVNKIMNLLSQMQNNLSTKDAGVTDEAKRPKQPLDPEIMIFFLRRGLLDTNAPHGTLNKDKVEELKRVSLQMNDQSKNFRRFQEWSTFTSLLAMGSANPGGEPPLAILTDPSLVTQMGGGQLPLPQSAILNPYNRLYWKKSSEIPDNPYKSIAGNKDHWVFVPYLQDADGNFVKWDLVGEDTIISPELGPNVRQPFCTTATSLTRKDEESQLLPAYDLRWYGETPPKSPEDFIREVAILLSNQNFLPKTYPDASGNSRQVFDGNTFSKDFWRDVIVKQTLPLVAVLNPKDGKIRCFLSWNDGQFDRSQVGPEEIAVRCGGLKYTYDDSVGGGFWSPDDSMYSYDLAHVSQTYYWPVWGEADGTGLSKPRTDTTAFKEMLNEDFVAKIEGVDLNADQVTAWIDTLRIYCDRISNESSAKSAEMNTELQYSQQFLSTASQLLAKVNQTRGNVATNIR